MKFNINGQNYETDVDIRTTLLDLCRDHLGLTGSKKGCDHGQCGACTMLVNGRRINACLSLAIMHEGDTIVTVEGLGSAEHLSPLQQAFIQHDAYQCGYCTSGQLCSAVGMLEEYKDGWPSYVSTNLNEVPALTREEIAERMSGNLCRCAAYQGIVHSIQQVAEENTHENI
jgi:xanthine dehydrogenase YagT iron-sulfur-binding subunit